MSSNSSLAGCVKSLTALADTDRMDGIAKHSREVDLAQNRGFQEHFIRSMEFG